MLEVIRHRGTADMQKMAQQMMDHGNEFRGDRTSITSAQSMNTLSLATPVQNPTVKREIYDGSHKTTLPGKLVRSEGDKACKDPIVNAAYDGAGSVFEMYLKEYKRNSLDGNGLTLVSTVHHRKNFNNAFWNGQQMAYGDGDGNLFTNLTELSIVGHELSHGVVQFSGGLMYRDQSGALNESFADVFGALTVQYTNKESSNEADWLIGKVLGASIKGVALRSLKAPGEAYDDPMLGKDPQPYHMDQFVNTSSDNGGVHINSGIPNHAFYLLSRYLGGNAWEKAGQIWYDTMQSVNNPNATFHQWADKTVEKARDRFGSGSQEALFTRRAWHLVGISV
jgi:Zn-dependent metalloprotease